MIRQRLLPRARAASLAFAVLAAGALQAQPPEAAKKADASSDAEQDAARAAKFLQGAFKGEPTPEAAEMLIAILKGSQMGPGDGWFHPGQSRYGWKWLADKHGAKSGDAIPRDKFQGPAALFDRLDRNKDGVLRADDFDWSDRSAYTMQSATINYWFRRVNSSADGRLTREEWMKFFDEAARGKDHLTTDNLRDALLTIPSPPKKGPAVRPEGPTTEVLVRGLFRGEIGSVNEGPKLNDPAPDFTLKTRDGKEAVRLRDLAGKKPVVLVFGNVTCGPFRATYPRVDDLALRYKDDAVFVAVYVREAHPTDGWRMSSNDEAGVTFAQPRDYGERAGLAERCYAKLKMNMPLLVDEMDDRVGHAYSGMPARLYVIDTEGKVAYKSGRGPFGFKPDEMEQTLALLLLDRPAKAPPVKAAPPAKEAPAARVPVLKDADAWKRLPAAEKGGDTPLPAWARALADAMPRTTAAMLELDYLQRARSPLDAKLRGKMRWVAANANRCAYAEAYAAADLRRAGLGGAALKELAGDWANLPEKERAALTFARKLTLAADTVSDEEVKALIKMYGEKDVVAMVLLLAHANFQDRLLLVLGVPVEEGGPLPPAEVRFARGGEPPAVPARNAPEPLTKAPRLAPAEEWTPFDFTGLQSRLSQQRDRPGRIAVPSWEDVVRVLPKGVPTNRPTRIRWSLVCAGYQPELAFAWSACTRAFGEEAKQDRVFEESLFWVVTRTLNCFY
jgi:alkylhydroperoxidase family enzyme